MSAKDRFHQTVKNAVEVKSFLAASTIYEFHLAIGQYFNYRIALREKELQCQLYLGFAE